MPVIILNMGGEMLYILNQRLQAQGIAQDKAGKVLKDILSAMYNPTFLNELFKSQKIYTLQSTREIFEKLVHSSIMRLNTTSMDKLYDLMTLSLKRQLIGCNNPQDYIVITINHLESIKIIGVSAGVNDLIEECIQRFIVYYSTLTIGQFYTLKQTLLAFVQDRKTKVSLFLQVSHSVT